MGRTDQRLTSSSLSVREAACEYLKPLPGGNGVSLQGYKQSCLCRAQLRKQTFLEEGEALVIRRGAGYKEWLLVACSDLALDPVVFGGVLLGCLLKGAWRTLRRMTHEVPSFAHTAFGPLSFQSSARSSNRKASRMLRSPAAQGSVSDGSTATRGVCNTA